MVAQRITDEIREPTQRLAAFPGAAGRAAGTIRAPTIDRTAPPAFLRVAENRSTRPTGRSSGSRCAAAPSASRTAGRWPGRRYPRNCRPSAVADTAHTRSAFPGGPGAFPMRAAASNPCPVPFHARRAARAMRAGIAAPDPVAVAARRIPPDAPAQRPSGRVPRHRLP